MIARMADGEITVRLTPRARADAIVGQREDGTVLARVTAPAHEDRANEALRRMVARMARVGVSRVEIVRGARAREKTLRVQGLTAAELRAALGVKERPRDAHSS
jgi:uncharacterized protein YggU (UPF0235/DUF167 family)